MALALFDLDNTLLADDSDFLWGNFLVEKNQVDKARYDEANQRFYADYKKGTLDIFEFLTFSLKPLSEIPRHQLDILHNEFMRTIITPLMTQKGIEKLQQHRANGDTLVIITATNRFVTEPIAKAFKVDALIATEPEIIKGKYSGKVAGTPCFQQGKITRLEQWLTTHQQSLKGSYFYSDSHNDLPLLEKVDHAIAVDPDDKLTKVAQEKNWGIISFR